MNRFMDFPRKEQKIKKNPNEVTEHEKKIIHLYEKVRTKTDGMISNIYN